MRLAVALLAAAFCLGACEQPAADRAKPAAVAAAPKASPESATAEAAPWPQAAWTEWNNSDDGPKAYDAGGFHIELRAEGDEENGYLTRLVISDGVGKPLKLTPLDDGGMAAMAEFVAIKGLDPDLAPPQLLVRTFTFGAHCCFQYHLVGRRGDRWVVRNLDQWDGAGMPEPVDLDGDGHLELHSGDQAFLYAFGPYADSPVPRQVHRLVRGKLVDVSAEPRFRRIYEAAVADYREDCRERETPGPCLAYAANMARLGPLNDAWALIEQADPQKHPDDGTLLECWGGRTYCRGDKTIAVPSFRKKVELFLVDVGYLPKSDDI